jgi:membrane protein implicated in regulation of membrane protease activity
MPNFNGCQYNGIIIFVMEIPKTNTNEYLLADENIPASKDLRKQRLTTITIIIVGLILLTLLIVGLVFLLHPNTPELYVARIRDVFIIIMALESLIIGLILFILIFQVARLINLIQNEIKPILDSTNDTVSNLRGTTIFLSENLVEPVIKLNEYFAGLTRLIALFGLTKRK